MVEQTFSVVIFAAGQGKRLGAGKPKCLMEISGQPIFKYQLTELSNLPMQIYIVCGFRADLLTSTFLTSTPPGNLSFIYNDRYLEPQSISIKRALQAIPKDRPALFIDGDLLFKRATIELFLNASGNAVLLRECISKDAVIATVSNGKLSGFQRKPSGQLEWANIARYEPSTLDILAGLTFKETHHFELINSLVGKGTFFSTIIAETSELDEPSDIPDVQKYVSGL